MIVLLRILAFLLFVLPATAQAKPLDVVATFTILGDLVRQIGGEDVAVTTLVGADGDAHVYQPTPADARALATADLVVTNGLGFEGWMDRLIESAGYKGPVAVASAGVRPRAAPGHGQALDPHAWQDLRNGRRYAANIADALAKADPAHAAGYRARAAAYDDALARLDAEVRAGLAAIPAAERRLITSHDAFGYFADAYGLEAIGAQGLGTDSEPSAKDLARLIRQMRAEHVRVLFVENITDPRLVRQLARETKAVVGGTLYTDALSQPGGPAATYVAMFRHNLDEILKAFAAAGAS